MKTAKQIELELTQYDCTEIEAQQLTVVIADMELAGASNPWGFEQMQESLRCLRKY
jgi:hypothetical protein